MKSMTRNKYRAGTVSRTLELVTEASDGTCIIHVPVAVHFAYPISGPGATVFYPMAFDQVAQEWRYISLAARRNGGQFSTSEFWQVMDLAHHHARHSRMQCNNETTQPIVYQPTGPKYRSTGVPRTDYDFR